MATGSIVDTSISKAILSSSKEQFTTRVVSTVGVYGEWFSRRFIRILSGIVGDSVPRIVSNFFEGELLCVEK